MTVRATGFGLNKPQITRIRSQTTMLARLLFAEPRESVPCFPSVFPAPQTPPVRNARVALTPHARLPAPPAAVPPNAPPRFHKTSTHARVPTGAGKQLHLRARSR